MGRGYKTICPQCGGNDFYVTPFNQMGYCYHCAFIEKSSHSIIHKERGPIRDIRLYYTYLIEYAHKCLEQRHVDYLLTRGITTEQILTEKIGFFPDEKHAFYNQPISILAGIATRDGKNVLANRIVFPYWQGQLVAEIRGRSVDPHSELRYKNPYGDPYYRGADIFYKEEYQEIPHILTEGEIKTLIALRHGFPTVGMAGVLKTSTSYRPRTKVTVIFDTDVQYRTRLNVRNAIARLAQYIQNLYVITLPPISGKGELDTYLLTMGKTNLKILLESAQTYHEWKYER